MGLKDLEAMVKEVNATQVAPADKLTDSVYHYDSQAKIFELGEKFVASGATGKIPIISACSTPIISAMTSLMPLISTGLI